MSTPILIWQSYGNVMVYKAETPAQFVRLFDLVKEAVQGFGLENELADLDRRLATCPDLNTAVRLFSEFQKHVKGHESFELFMFRKLIEP